MPKRTLIEPTEQLTGEEMRYLIRNKGGKTAAHIWTGKDTACTMFSTGGLSSNRGYIVSDSTFGRRICTMCVNNAKKTASVVG